MLGKRGRQVEARVQQGGIKRHRLLKMVDGLFVLGVLVGCTPLLSWSRALSLLQPVVASNAKPSAAIASIRMLVFIAL